jgi:hypothetical protein
MRKESSMTNLHNWQKKFYFVMLILAGKQPKVSSWKNHFKHIFKNYYTFPTYFKIIHALIITIVLPAIIQILNRTGFQNQAIFVSRVK